MEVQINTTMKLTLAAAAAVGLGVIAAPALRAQQPPSAAAPTGPGMDHQGMMGGDRGGMMGDMSKMMEECNRMMQSMNAQPGSGRPDQPRETPPANPGGRG